jgi:hypothetical protein
MMMATMLALAMAGAPDDPLAPARDGRLQCYAPNVAKRTCMAIAGYVRRPDGTYLNRADVLIAPEQNLSMVTETVVTVRGDAVCGPISRADLLAGKVFIGGAAVPGAQADGILAQVAQAYETLGMLDKESCTVYTPDGDHLRADATIDGVAHPELTLPVIWIGPNDGYTLGK